MSGRRELQPCGTAAAYQRGCRCEACRAAKAEYHRLYRAANAEKVREKDRRYRAANAEKVRETKRETKRRWREANPERYREANRAAVRRWRETNPDAVRSHSDARRARKAGAPVVEIIDRSAIIARDRRTCWLCGVFIPEDAPLHLDHVIPLARGGSHAAGNLKVACAPCNFRKGASVLPPSAFPPVTPWGGEALTRRVGWDALALVDWVAA